jgi:hypothetical protein
MIAWDFGKVILFLDEPILDPVFQTKTISILSKYSRRYGIQLSALLYNGSGPYSQVSIDVKYLSFLTPNRYILKVAHWF